MFLLWILVLIGIPLVLRLRTRVTTLEGEVARQQEQLQTLTEQLRRVRRTASKHRRRGQTRAGEAPPEAGRCKAAGR